MRKFPSRDCVFAARARVDMLLWMQPAGVLTDKRAPVWAATLHGRNAKHAFDIRAVGDLSRARPAARIPVKSNRGLAVLLGRFHRAPAITPN